MKLNLTYMSGAGNLFTVIDNREYELDEKNLSELAQTLCSAQGDSPLATEGLLILNNSKDGHSFETLYFNPDGTSGMMCGNGARCAFKFAEIAGYIDHKKDFPVNFSMSGNIYKGEFAEKSIKIEFPPPVKIDSGLELKLNNKNIPADYVDVNSDHIVIDVNDLEQPYHEFTEFELTELGQKIRNMDRFSPKGVNVNFYEIKDNKEVELITYERGVEAFTGACGTGAISTALSIALKGKLNFPITIIPPSGSQLMVSIKGKPENIGSVILEGSAEVIGERTVDITSHLSQCND